MRHTCAPDMRCMLVFSSCCRWEQSRQYGTQDNSLQSAVWVRERRSVNAADRAERAATAAERAAGVAQRAAASARRPTAAEPRPYYRRVRQHLEAGCGLITVHTIRALSARHTRHAVRESQLQSVLSLPAGVTLEL